MQEVEFEYIINNYVTDEMDDFFKMNNNTFENYFNDIINNNKDENEAVEKIYNDFIIDGLFNNWDGKNNAYNFKNKIAFSCFLNKARLIKNHISGFNAIKYWNDYTIWMNNEFGISPVIFPNTEENVWNTIAYFLASSKQISKTLLINKFITMFNEYKETLEDSRISCGICYENVKLYTGCSCCNHNYLCRKCYHNLKKENVCPFCRCTEMIKEYDVNDYDDIILPFWEIGELKRIKRSLKKI